VAGIALRFFLFLSFVAVLAPAVNLVQAQSTCGAMSEPQTLEDAYIKQTTPLIFGDRYQVARMKVRFINKANGAPLETESVRVHYRWRWLEYPYSEHAWGAWVQASDSCTCHPDKDGWIEVPAHEVIPRGWYKGKYTSWPYSKTPRFERVEIVALTGNFARTSLLPKDLKQFENQALIITVQDGWKTTTEWQPSTSP
jgi:hypothetical protein